MMIIPKKIISTIFSLAITISVIANDSISSIIPFPKKIQTQEGYLLGNRFHFNEVQDSLKPLIPIFENNIDRIFSINHKLKRNIPVKLIIEPTLNKEQYLLKVDQSGVLISGSNFNSLSMGLTTLTQLIQNEGQSLKINYCQINDYPTYSYRALMLDVARQPIEYQTLFQCVDLCNFYKLRYLQLHLTDDQSFTFSSSTFPQLATEGHSYTRKQLTDLVKYAKDRGVIIIPELEVPGHSVAMCKALPNVFGNPKEYVINMIDPNVIHSVDQLIEELSTIFYTSPYIHIGGDEANLSKYAENAQVKKYIADNNLDNVHDVFLQFVNKMNEIVKKHGKKTLVWESFPGKGSRKVTIPNDILVIAWETLYQRPESLLKNGYSIINASWKPIYITPGRRWSPEYIYKWNMHRWENHWNITPSFLHPIQLNSDDKVLGGQMCSWEMDDPSQIISLEKRIPALSENLWNDTLKTNYDFYRDRSISTTQKFQKLIFPVVKIHKGFLSPCSYGLDDNRINYFQSSACEIFQFKEKGQYITYSIDGSFPGPKASKIKDSLQINRSQKIKYALYNKRNQCIGYQSIDYRFKPIQVTHIGKLENVLDRNIFRDKENFDNQITVILSTKIPGSIIKYSINGSAISLNSLEYVKPIILTNSTQLKAQCFLDNKPIGEPYSCNYQKLNKEQNMTTQRPIFSNSNKESLNVIVDGIVDVDRYWSSNGSSEVIIDLEKEQSIQAINTFTFWDGKRYYQYVLYASRDGKNWCKIADRSNNEEIASPTGYIDCFEPQSARYIKIGMLRNSANNWMHLVEIRAY